MAGVPEMFAEGRLLDVYAEGIVDGVASGLHGGGIIGDELRMLMEDVKAKLEQRAREGLQTDKQLVADPTVSSLGALAGLLGIERPVDVSGPPYEGPRDL